MSTEDSSLQTTRKKSGFAGDVLKLVSSTAFAQMISILAAPIMTRLYAPDAYGVASLFGSIAGIIGICACMRYELAIMLPKRDGDAANLLGVSLGFTLLISVLAIPLVWWGRALLVRWLNAPTLSSYLWLVPLAVFVQGVFLALNYWNSRTRHFGRLSMARVTSSMTTTPLALGLGFAGYATAGSMIGAGITGQALATSVLGGQIWRDDRKVFFRFIRWRGMWEGIKRHRKFPLISTWSALMNTVSASLPVLLLAAFFSPTVVGFYALGNRLLGLPMAMIGGAIAQVFFQRAAEAKHGGTLPAVIGNVFLRLWALGLFPFLVVMVIGKDVFSVILGSQWAESGIYAQILAPWVMFQFISSPMSNLFSVLELQGTGLLFNSILLMTRIASLLIGGLLNSILVVLVLFSISGSLLYLYLCLLTFKKSGVFFSSIARNAFKTLFISLITLLPVAILKVCGIQSVIVVIVGCMCVLIYYISLCFRDEILRKLVTDTLLRRQ